MTVLGALIWFFIGAATTVSIGRNAIQMAIDNITMQVCEILPFLCGSPGIGM